MLFRSTGFGSPLAFPGGISGALVVGLMRNLLIKWNVKHVHLAGLTEPIGTVLIGAPLSSLLVQALIAAGTSFFSVAIPTLTWMSLFAASCIPGAVVGWLLILTLYKAGISYRNYIANPKTTSD